MTRDIVDDSDHISRFLCDEGEGFALGSTSSGLAPIKPNCVDFIGPYSWRGHVSPFLHDWPQVVAVYIQGGRSRRGIKSNRYDRYPSTVLRLKPLDGIEEDETLKKCGDSLLGGLGPRWTVKSPRTRQK
ncbi:hypothetical protein MTR_4g099420 [Medicago truncatula]|uniref:Uncharacterized protein n=1 Tax=Medicago truncatula TaxID=3880 RepID=A0A072UP60_MEDTR|nr:hypothetical protein MTR_4g099420 [Medicago truncatula]